MNCCFILFLLNICAPVIAFGDLSSISTENALDLTALTSTCETFNDREEFYTCERKIHRLHLQKSMIRARLLSAMGIRDPNYTIPSSVYTSRVAIVRQQVRAVQVSAEQNQIVLESEESDYHHRNRLFPRSTALMTYLFANHSIVVPPPAASNSSPFPRAQFDLSKLTGMTLDYTVINASLFVFIKCPAVTPLPTLPFKLTLTVHRLNSPVSIDSMPFISELKVLNPCPVGTYVKLPMLLQLQEWVGGPSSNFGLSVKCTHQGNEDLVVRNGSPDDRSQSMFIEVRVRENRNQYPKSKLKIRDCPVDDFTTKDCCRYPLEIDFEEFGWDWIVAPKRYMAYYCAGDCPLTHMSLSARSHMIQQIQRQNTSLNLGVCCAPSIMSGIDMLFFNEAHDIVQKRVPNMVVQKCTCS